MTVGEVLENMTRTYRDLKPHLYGDDGALRSYVNVYVNDEDIRYLARLDTSVSEQDTVSIVPSIAGGVEGPAIDTRPDVRLLHEEILRYSRHLIIPEVAVAGQKKLKSAKVVIIGAGGLGSPLALYLAAAGVGTLGIVDFDTVELTNLQRQILHATDDLGRPKLASATRAVHAVNPHVTVIPHETWLTSDNAMDVLAPYDIVVDGTDNFATRYLVNDACVLLGKPNVYGSIFRFEGQVTVFDARRGPCYRCLYSAPPPPGLVPSCAEGGVLGVLPGIIGTLQALETIKLILGAGDSLIGRLVLFDALRFSFRELSVRKDPGCPVCGEHPSIRELVDYEEFCGTPAHAAGAHGGNGAGVITVQDLHARLKRGDHLRLVDVREPHESEIASIGGQLIPLRELPSRTNELDPTEEIVVYCRTGDRSGRAVEFLRGVGFRHAMNLHGGINAWAASIDPSLPTY
jgi:adenylyltransferase/sulfurtransferase